MLRLDNIHVSYGPIKAVRGVSLEVKEGDIVALLGPNGAGKTSLISSVVGLTPIASGRVFFDCAEITGEQTERIVARGITLTPTGGACSPISLSARTLSSAPRAAAIPKASPRISRNTWISFPF